MMRQKQTLFTRGRGVFILDSSGNDISTALDLTPLY